MPPDCDGRVLSCARATAAEANAAIRALMLRTYGRPLWRDEAAEYGRLLEEWAAACRDGLTEAA
jgi:hypothetical protein